ncbi:MlaE family ABC transporter permease [Ichthyobacterium seriolicida]|uniref:ABC transporter permease n=1 Tax=Ichthyobacterium seriolicida TaxID=242600 RepID=A0A1J1E6K7_9FLAO|nr:ABC transporter permease [Ichthyobacterium seriolicida]BAV94966.1 ABC transporter permease [Ichthyobacterium seriolicida]
MFQKTFIYSSIASIGLYFKMLGRVLKKHQKWSIFRELIFKEISDLCINSLNIVIFISIFMGAIIAIQTNYNLLSNHFIPKYFIGIATRQSVILEFAPTMISIILAGKVGSYIASSIGTMRITEQIDALDVMGVNSLNLLVLPKIIAGLTFFPLLIAISMITSVLGGWIAGAVVGSFSPEDYLIGVQMNFKPFQIIYSFTKTLFFSFVIITVPSFYGYYVNGGALEVGRASTKAVVWTIVHIIVLNYLLTKVILK